VPFSHRREKLHEAKLGICQDDHGETFREGLGHTSEEFAGELRGTRSALAMPDTETPGHLPLPQHPVEHDNVESSLAVEHSHPRIERCLILGRVAQTTKLAALREGGQINQNFQRTIRAREMLFHLLQHPLASRSQYAAGDHSY